MDRAEAIKQIELYLEMENLGGAIEVALRMAIAALANNGPKYVLLREPPEDAQFIDTGVDALRKQEALEAELKGEKWRHGITKAKLEGTDMRSVVLCEHCLSGREPEGQAKGSGLVQCGNSGILHKPDHYCGDGRRKADSIVIRGTCADRLL